MNTVERGTLLLVFTAGMGSIGCAVESTERLEISSQDLGRRDCPAGTNVIIGSNGDDVLIGTAGDDCIVGLKGNDELHGLGGDDFYIGGGGDDVIHGGPGNDVIHGGAGADLLFGEAGDDTIYAGGGNDTADGGDGADVLLGGGGADVLEGGAGDDTILGERGNDELSGSGGDDVLIPGGKGTADGGPGTDACVGTNCEEAPLDVTDCTHDGDCQPDATCVIAAGVCRPSCLSDADGDGTCDGADLCPGYDDAVDDDGDGKPDGCDRDPEDCVAGSVRPGVLETNVLIDSDQAAPSVEGVWCVVGHLDVMNTTLPDLTALADLVVVTGRLTVQNNDSLVSLEGLSDLHSAGLLVVQQNDSLQSLAGAGSLRNVRGLNVGINAALTDLTELGDVALSGPLSVSQNAVLTSLDGLQGATSGTTMVSIANNPSLADLSGLSGLSGVPFNLFVINNDSLVRLDGLEQVTSVGGTLRVSHNDALNDGSALLGVASVGDLQVYANPLLSECFAAEILNDTGATCSNCGGSEACATEADCSLAVCSAGSCITEDAPGGTACSVGVCTEEGACVPAECAPGATGPGIIDGDLIIDGTDTAGDLARAQGAWCVTGNVHVVGTGLTDLQALDSLTHIAGSLRIEGNTGDCYTCATGHENLTSLTGLESLVAASGISIRNNPALTTLSPLANVSSPYSAIIVNNDSLVDLQGLSSPSVTALVAWHNDHLSSFDGLQSTEIAHLIAYENPVLSDISALSASTVDMNGVYIHDTALTNLTGLEGVGRIVTLGLHDNPQLSDISALSGTSVTRSIELQRMPQLTSLAGLAGTEHLSTLLDLRDLGITSLEGLEALKTAHRIDLHSLPNVTSLAPLSGLQSAEIFGVGDVPLTTLAGIEAVSLGALMAFDMPTLMSCGGPMGIRVGGAVLFHDLPHLSDLSCLSGLQLDDLDFYDCDSVIDFSTAAGLVSALRIRLRTMPTLTSLSGLQGLTTLYEFQAENTGLVDLSGLDNVTSIEGTLDVMYNQQLVSLSGLESVTSIGTLSLANNGALGSLASLDNLTTLNWASISHNDSLRQCEVDAFLSRLGIDCPWCTDNAGAATCE